jgi:hypothetical protein
MMLDEMRMYCIQIAWAFVAKNFGDDCQHNHFFPLTFKPAGSITIKFTSRLLGKRGWPKTMSGSAFAPIPLQASS